MTVSAESNDETKIKIYWPSMCIQRRRSTTLAKCTSGQKLMETVTELLYHRVVINGEDSVTAAYQ